MYQVRTKTTIINPEKPEARYKPLYHTGLYSPKSKSQNSKVIEQKIIKYITKVLKEKNPQFDFATKAIEIKKIRCDFVYGEE